MRVRPLALRVIILFYTVNVLCFSSRRYPQA